MRFSHEPPASTAVGGDSIAAWALETYASHRGKQVSIQPLGYPPDPALPVVGFERNEPFRGLLGDYNLDLPLTHLDPGVIYHWKGRTLVRPSSVEGWIEAGREWFSGAGFRDFWESVWNLSVAAWNFVDEYGSAPIESPASFPYLQLSAWQGFKWNKILFAKASDYLSSFAIEPADEFRNFVDSQIRFAFGRGIGEVPMGLASMILNAPSTSYLMERAKGERAALQRGSESEGSGQTWRIPFQAGPGLRSGTPHQVFYEDSVDGGAIGAVVLTVRDDFRGFVYFRSGTGNAKDLGQALARSLGKEWGELDPNGIVPLSGLCLTLERKSFHSEVEPEWPWLGPARAYLEARRPLL